MFDTYNCGELLKADANLAAEVFTRFGGTAKAHKPTRNTVRVVAYFPLGTLTYDLRAQITSALTNQGIFAF